MKYLILIISLWASQGFADTVPEFVPETEEQAQAWMDHQREAISRNRALLPPMEPIPEQPLPYRPWPEPPKPREWVQPVVQPAADQWI